MRDLTTISNTLGLIIFVICHAQKTIGKDDREPSSADFRDSSFVIQESDTALMIWRNTDTNEFGEEIPSNISTLKIDHHRRTGTQLFKMKLIKKGNYLQECIL